MITHLLILTTLAIASLSKPTHAPKYIEKGNLGVYYSIGSAEDEGPKKPKASSLSLRYIERGNLGAYLQGGEMSNSVPKPPKREKIGDVKKRLLEQRASNRNTHEDWQVIGKSQRFDHGVPSEFKNIHHLASSGAESHHRTSSESKSHRGAAPEAHRRFGERQSSQEHLRYIHKGNLGAYIYSKDDTTSEGWNSDAPRANYHQKPPVPPPKPAQAYLKTPCDAPFSLKTSRGRFWVLRAVPCDPAAQPQQILTLQDGRRLSYYGQPQLVDNP